MIPILSKSRFLSGLQCPLRLWFQCYSPELAAPISPAQQAIFDMGHEVGRLATELYPGGRRIEEDQLHHKEAQESTVEAVGDRNIPAIFKDRMYIYDKKGRKKGIWRKTVCLRTG